MAHKLALLLFASFGLLNAQISFVGPRSHLDDDDHAPVVVFGNTKLEIKAHDHDDQDSWVVKGKGYKFAKVESHDQKSSSYKSNLKADKDDRKWSKKDDKRNEHEHDDHDHDDHDHNDHDHHHDHDKHDDDHKKQDARKENHSQQRNDRDDRKWSKKADKDDKKRGNRDQKWQWRGQKGDKHDVKLIEDEVQAPAIGKLVILNNSQEAHEKGEHKEWKKNKKQIEHEDQHDNDDLRPVNLVNFRPLPQKRPDWDDANKGIDTRNNVNNVLITTYGEVQNPPHLSNPPPAQVAKKIDHQVNKADQKATDSIFKYHHVTINTDVADEDNSKDHEHQHQDNRKGDKKLNIYYGDDVDSKIYVKKKANEDDSRREDDSHKKKIKKIDHDDQHRKEENSKGAKSLKNDRDERKSDGNEKEKVKKGNLSKNNWH